MEVYSRVGGGGLGVASIRQLRWFGHFLSERFQVWRDRYKGIPTTWGPSRACYRLLIVALMSAWVVYGRGEAEVAESGTKNHTISRHPPATSIFQLKAEARSEDAIKDYSAYSKNTINEDLVAQQHSPRLTLHLMKTESYMRRMSFRVSNNILQM